MSLLTLSFIIDNICGWRGILFTFSFYLDEVSSHVCLCDCIHLEMRLIGRSNNMYISNCYKLAFTVLGNWNIKSYIIVFILYLSMCHCISVFNTTSLLSEMFSVWTLHQYIINQSSFQIKSYSPNKFASLNIYFYK